jgi:hypothetical protein
MFSLSTQTSPNVPPVLWTGQTEVDAYREGHRVDTASHANLCITLVAAETNVTKIVDFSKTDGHDCMAGTSTCSAEGLVTVFRGAVDYGKLNQAMVEPRAAQQTVCSATLPPPNGCTIW